jgi:fatty acid-binding protein DegV
MISAKPQYLKKSGRITKIFTSFLSFFGMVAILRIGDKKKKNYLPTTNLQSAVRKVIFALKKEMKKEKKYCL